VHVKDNYVAYLRESKKEILLVVVARKKTKIYVDLTAYGYTHSKTLYGVDFQGSVLQYEPAAADVGIWRLKSAN
jgi:hypothetical protein